MKRIISFTVIVFMFCVVLVGCSEKNDVASTTTTTKNIIESSTTETTTERQTEKQTEKQTENRTDENTPTTTTKKYQSNPLVSDEDMEKIENSDAEVYFTDNPENKYITAIADKYGSKKENLIALVKVNAEFPSVYVLEFSGKKDANGELVMTYDELRYMYEINESKNTIIKASKNGLDNDGANFFEAKILITLAKEYFIPELPNLKENKRLPE
ncbi:MAG: hypothetical protein IKU15_05150 [Clostridia bacterium]|nr:hypothetical protein [Clostridia bacterium]